MSKNQNGPKREPISVELTDSRKKSHPLLWIALGVGLAMLFVFLFNGNGNLSQEEITTVSMDETTAAQQAMVDTSDDDRPVVTVLRLSGVIGDSPNHGINYQKNAHAIRMAFAPENLKGVLLIIDSPGGSVITIDEVGHLLGSEIERRKEMDPEFKVIVQIETVAASGGYWLAVYGDEIYARNASIVGSIGVVANYGWAFPGLAESLGIEKRQFTAGDYKRLMSEDKEMTDEAREQIESRLEHMHRVFKDHINSQRGDRITAPEEVVFSGAYWDGRTAKEMGLIDGIAYHNEIFEAAGWPVPAEDGDVRYVRIKATAQAEAKSVLSADMFAEDAEQPQGALERMADAFARALVDELEAKAKAEEEKMPQIEALHPVE